MPLPAGFKVNGSKVDTSRVPIPPRVAKIIALLDKVPANELLTTAEIGSRLALGVGGNFVKHPALTAYREKVDGNRLYWGNRKSIAQLRKQLTDPEATSGKN